MIAFVSVVVSVVRDLQFAADGLQRLSSEDIFC